MQELIDRVQLRKKIAELSTSLLNEWDTAGVLLLIDNAPTIDPMKHGRWIFDGADYQCSACGGYQRRDTQYCPICGAKMDADE